MEELSTSFDDEVKPMVVEIEGTQHRLTGTADAQYEEWRNLLLELYLAETGFVPDVAVFTEALPLAEEIAETEEQEVDVYIIEPDDLETEEEAAAESAPETIAGAT